MTTLHSLIEYGIPESFFLQSPDEKCCIFLVCCHSPGQQMGTPPEVITGYTSGEFQEGGMPFWYSLIHPEDITAVSGTIIDAHENLSSREQNDLEAIPLVLRYRLKHRQGSFVRIKDSRFLLSYSGGGVIDGILCRIEPDEERNPGEFFMDDLLRKEKSCNKMLDIALKHHATKGKQVLGDLAIYNRQNPSNGAQRLTRREKQILGLVANGFSSKMIADQCSISINTVETHRRHLLEKLGAKNSMELIKEASKVFVL